MQDSSSPVMSYLRRSANFEFDELVDSLQGLTDEQAWWRSEGGGDCDYLHTSGSILGIVLHIASCKVLYAEYAFLHGQLTLTDMGKRAREVEPHLSKAIDWLKESHDQWMDSWKALTDADLPTPCKTNWGEMWTTEKILTTMLHHDVYHSGQIRFIRALMPKEMVGVKPISEADLWDQYLSQLAKQ